MLRIIRVMDFYRLRINNVFFMIYLELFEIILIMRTLIYFIVMIGLYCLEIKVIFVILSNCFEEFL